MKTISVRDFDARGDGRTDDTASLQRALDVATISGGTLEIPFGDYLTGPLTVRRRDGQGTLSIIGDGSQFPLQVAGFAATRLKYIGPPGGTVLHCYGLNGGQIGGFNIDGNGLAETGFLLESAMHVGIGPLVAQRTVGFGHVLQGSDAGVYCCEFRRLATHDCAGGLKLTGTSQDVNVAQCTFTRTDLHWRGPLDGLRLESADNCAFAGTSIVGSGDGFLLTLCPADATKLGAVENHFLVLDGSPQMIVAEAHARNTIVGLSRVNGIPGIGGTQRHRVVLVGEAA